MSALPQRADIAQRKGEVRKVPKADVPHFYNADPPRRSHARRGAAIALGRLRGGQGELKYRTARFICLCPQPAAMGLDDRSTNRQPHARAAGLRGIKCIEHALEMRRIDARPGIVHCHKDICMVLPGADQ